MTRPLVSFICATYNRPTHLGLFLRSVLVQTSPDWECLVMDEAQTIAPAYNEKVCNETRDGDPRVRHVNCERSNDWGQTAKRHGANVYARGQFFAFPNDDAYYTPTFVQTMTTFATMNGLDLVYCDWLYDGFGYAAHPVRPEVGHIDVGGFLISRRCWTAMREHWQTGKQTADGEFVQAIVKAGYAHGKAPGVLYVKN